MDWREVPGVPDFLSGMYKWACELCKDSLIDKRDCGCTFSAKSFRCASGAQISGPAIARRVPTPMAGEELCGKVCAVFFSSCCSVCTLGPVVRKQGGERCRLDIPREGGIPSSADLNTYL